MIVVDASVLANALADDTEAGRTARVALCGQELAAPDLIAVEVTSVLRARWLAGKVSTQRFEQALEDLTDIPIDMYPTLPLMFRAFGLKDNMTPYDAAYVALAETLNCALVTADRKLAKAPGAKCDFRVVE
jgi:predicted nucleic acid-binding protein